MAANVCGIRCCSPFFGQECGEDGNCQCMAAQKCGLECCTQLERCVRNKKCRCQKQFKCGGRNGGCCHRADCVKTKIDREPVTTCRGGCARGDGPRFRRYQY